MPFSVNTQRIKHKVCFNTLFYRTIKMSKQTEWKWMEKNGKKTHTHIRKSWNPSHFHKICSMFVFSSTFFSFFLPLPFRLVLALLPLSKHFTSSFFFIFYSDCLVCVHFSDRARRRWQRISGRPCLSILTIISGWLPWLTTIPREYVCACLCV